MAYYSAVKKNEILPLAATLMDLGSAKCFSGALIVKKKKKKKNPLRRTLQGLRNRSSDTEDQRGRCQDSTQAKAGGQKVAGGRCLGGKIKW